MKIHFLLNKRARSEPNAIFAAAMQILERDGLRVSSWIVEEQLRAPDGVDLDHDLFVLKSRTALSLILAGILHDRGRRFLNPYPACALLQNKIAAAGRLAAAGVPAPRSWVTGDFSLLRELASSMPLIVRFQRARREACFRVVHGPDGLAGIPPQEQPMLVQQFFAGTGDALKVYVVGEQVFAVRKPSSRKDDRGIGAPCAVTPSVRDIALRCGRAFGLGVYGIDIIDGTDGPVVVELNHSPGFRGVPDVAPLLARYIEDFVRGRTILPAVLPSVSAARLQPPAVAWDMAASEPTAQGWRFPRPWAGVSCLA